MPLNIYFNQTDVVLKENSQKRKSGQALMLIKGAFISERVLFLIGRKHVKGIKLKCRK